MPSPWLVRALSIDKEKENEAKPEAPGGPAVSAGSS